MVKWMCHKEEWSRRTGPDGAYIFLPKPDDDDDDDDDEIWQGGRTQVETVKTKFLDFLFDRCPRYGSLNFTQNGPTYSDRATVKQL